MKRHAKIIKVSVCTAQGNLSKRKYRQIRNLFARNIKTIASRFNGDVQLTFLISAKSNA